MLLLLHTNEQLINWFILLNNLLSVSLCVTVALWPVFFVVVENSLAEVCVDFTSGCIFLSRRFFVILIVIPEFLYLNKLSCLLRQISE